MVKVIKVVFFTFLGIALLLGLGFAALVFWVNPNNFKPAISREVYKITGRDVAINGDIHWSIFPTPGLQVSDVSLKNAPAFANEPFAQIGEMAISIKLTPLLHGKIETNTLTISHLTLNLTKNIQGTTNWQDLLPSRPAHTSDSVFTITATTPANLPAQASASSENAPVNDSLKIRINGITIKDSVIHWNNQQSHQQANINIANLETSAVNVVNEPFKVWGSFAVDNAGNAAQPLSSQFSIDALLKILGNEQRVTIESLNLRGGIKYNVKDIAFQLQTQGEFNGANQTINLSSLTLTANQMKIKANVIGQRVLSLPEFQGNIAISPFDLGTFLQSLKIQVGINNPKALQNAHGNFSYAATRNSFMIDNFQGSIGDSDVVGSLGITDIAKKKANINLSVGELTLDNYFFATAKVQANAQDPWLAGLVNTAFALPVTSSPSNGTLDWLRQLTVQGQVTVNQLVFGKLQATNVKTVINQQNGVIVLNPVNANFYEGNFAGDVRADIRNNLFVYTTNQRLSQVNIATLVKQLLHSDVISGTGQVNSSLTASGTDLNTFTRTLNGQVDIQIANGTITGISLIDQLETTYAMFKNMTIPAFKEKDNTNFVTLTAHADIQNGIVSNKDLTISTSGLNAKGSGQIDLVNQTIDYRLEVTVVGEQLPQISKLADLAGGSIPVIISGSLDHPKASPDYPTLVKRVAENRLGKNLDDVQDKINKVGNKLGKKLKSLLGN